MNKLKDRIQDIIAYLEQEDDFGILCSTNILWRICIPLFLEELALGKASLLA
jgi:hypothetical protein